MLDVTAVPRFGVAGWTVVLAAIGYIALLALSGRRAYRRLRDARPADPNALVAFYRANVVRKAGLLVPVALLPVAVPRLRPAQLGLAWPHGPEAGERLRFFLLLVVTILATSLWWRRAARRGEEVPRPARLDVLVAATRAERRWAWAVAVSAGVGEELAFRALLIAAGVAAGLSPVVAAVASSVLFGLAHLYQGWPGMLVATGGGLMMCYFALPTGSLLLPVVLHVLLDVRALVLVPLPAVRAEPA